MLSYYGIRNGFIRPVAGNSGAYGEHISLGGLHIAAPDKLVADTIVC